MNPGTQGGYQANRCAGWIDAKVGVICKVNFSASKGELFKNRVAGSWEENISDSETIRRARR